jgi:hypothetical protein
MTVFNDILIPRFKEAFTLNYFQAMLAQFAFFGAYFIGSLLYLIISTTIGEPRSHAADWRRHLPAVNQRGGDHRRVCLRCAAPGQSFEAGLGADHRCATNRNLKLDLI